MILYYVLLIFILLQIIIIYKMIKNQWKILNKFKYVVRKIHVFDDDIYTLHSPNNKI